MKKQELLKQFDDDLLDKLFGFCYARTNDSYEAQELCSDIIFALVKAAHTDGEITNINNLQNGYFNADAEIVAAKVAELIKKSVPEYLHGEWKLANTLANMPILDAVVEVLIEKGILTPPENGIGAEGCWMSVMK